MFHFLGPVALADIIGVMMFTVIVLLASLVGDAFAVTGSDSWCGKYYMQGYPPVNPGGQFPIPMPSDQLLLAPRCTPRESLYISGDTGSFLVSTILTKYWIDGAEPYYASSFSPLEVTISTGDRILGVASVPPNATNFEIPVYLFELEATKEPYNVTCNFRSADGRTYESFASLPYMPTNLNGSVVKIDYLTEALLVENALMYPFGFYAYYDTIQANLSTLNTLKEEGVNAINIVPDADDYPSPTSPDFQAVLGRMEELGLWLIYDMRFSYLNLTSVALQVEAIKSFKYLLLWYTGDEPDGTSDPLNGTSIARDLINSIDGYHPVSLVLNCQDYYFTEYTNGADIAMEDAYPIGINATFSIPYGTSCTPELGDCGCDNCGGNITDVSTRVDQFVERLEILGERKPVWCVLQGFGDDEGDPYWTRVPTTEEMIIMFILCFNHRATGIQTWVIPTYTSISDAYSLVGPNIEVIADFILNEDMVKRNISTAGGIDGAIFTVGVSSLVSLTNVLQSNATVTIPDIFTLKTTELVNTGAELVPTFGALKVELGPLASLLLVVYS